MRAPRVRRPSVAAAAATLAMIAAWPADAYSHDYWLVPDVLLSPAPTDAALSLFVGDGFIAEEEKEMSPERTARFVHVHGGSQVDLLPQAHAAQRPAFRVTSLSPGGHLFGLDRNAAHIELEAAKFDAYLREEGLEAIAAERARRGESERPGRERYERFLKALVQVGAARDETYRRELSQTLEIVPLADPTVAAAGATLPVAVRFEGAPLKGARLERFSRLARQIEKMAVTTDRDGTAAVPMPGDGVHLLRLVHMVRCEGCADADWRSYWAAYTFASGPAEIVRPTVAPPMVAPRTTGKGTLVLVLVASAVVAGLGATIFWKGRRAQNTV